MLNAQRLRPTSFAFCMAAFVTFGVALGVMDTLTPLPTAYSASSKTSVRIKGSPPVNTSIGYSISEISSISAFPSSVESSNGFRVVCASALQCRQCSSQARVSSHITMNGTSLKSGILILGFIPLTPLYIQYKGIYSLKHIYILHLYEHTKAADI